MRVHKNHERPFDIVLLGATGFTGTLTAEYLARHVPANCRWALAGRNRQKLEQLQDSLAASHPHGPAPALLHADTSDTATLRAVARAARVVATTVGPYTTLGPALVGACAEAGTDYLDITGEPEFVDTMYLRHHATANRSGARLVHAAGFLATVFDLGVLATVQHLPEAAPKCVTATLHTNFTRSSSGSLASYATALARLRLAAAAARKRREAEPPPRGRTIQVSAGPLRRDPATRFAAIPLPTFGGKFPFPDAQAVTRSAGELALYGPRFRYRRYVAVPRLLTAASVAVGVGALAVLLQFATVGRHLSRCLTPQAGPGREQRARTWFTVRFDGRSPGAQATTEVSGGDPGYEETAKILAESALSLAFDDLPLTAGQVSPALAMGDALITRLRDAGITFETSIAKPSSALTATTRDV